MASYKPFPVYDGHTDPGAFIQQFRILAELNDWTAAQQYAKFKIFIGSKAEAIYNAGVAAGTITDIATAYAIIKAGCGVSKDACFDEFNNRQLKTGESISVFASSLSDILNRGVPDLDVNLRNSMMRKRLCDVVPESVRPIIRLSGILNTPLDSILVSLDAEMPAHSISVSPFKTETTSLIKQEPVDINYTQTNRSSNNNSFRPQQSRFQQPQRNQQYNNVSNSYSRFMGQCFYCRQFGHRQSNCNKLKLDLENGSQQQNTRFNQRPNQNQQYNQPQQQQRQQQSSSNQIPSNNYRSSTSNQSNTNVTELQSADTDSESFPYSYQVSLQEAEKNNNIQNFAIEIITMGAVKPTSQLLLVKVKVNLLGEIIVVTALVDGGSSHSFCSPNVLTVSQIKELTNPFRATAVNYNIKSATENKSSCCVEVSADIEMNGWSANQNFIISNDVVAYDMVLGRNFLIANGFVVSHSDDSMTSGDHVKIKLNVPKTDSNNISIQKSIDEIQLALKVHQAGISLLAEKTKLIDSGPTVSKAKIIDFD